MARSKRDPESKEDSAPMSTDTEKMQREDHDTLIRVEGKIETLTSTVQTSHIDLTTKLGDHEGRLRVIEQIHDRIDPLGSAQRLEVLERWREAREAGDASRNRVIAIGASIAGALAGLLINLAGLLAGAWGTK